MKKLKTLVQPQFEIYLHNYNVDRLEKAYVVARLDTIIRQNGIPSAIFIEKRKHTFDLDGKDIENLQPINSLYRADIPNVKEKYFTRDRIMKYLEEVWNDYEIIFEYEESKDD